MKSALRLLVLVILAGLALQVYFVARIALMAVVDPESTAFERSEMWLVTKKDRKSTRLNSSHRP